MVCEFVVQGGVDLVACPVFGTPQLHYINHLARERQGGGQKRGGVQNLSRRPPTEKSFRPPSPRYVLPPPIPFLVVSLLEIPRISLS